MPITLACACGAIYSLKDEFAGKSVQCFKCNATTTVPPLGTAPIEAAVPAPATPAAAAAPAPSAQPQMQSSAGYWLPDAKVMSHAGEPLPPEAMFFAAPPQEIGAVLTAQTSLKVGKTPWAPAVRAILVAAPAVGGYVLGQTLCRGAELQGAATQWVCGLLAAVPALMMWWATRFSHRLSYVGGEGAAVITCSGGVENVQVEKLFMFRDAKELRTREVQVYNTGFYYGLGYRFCWTDAEGKERFLVSGSTETHKISFSYVPPKPTDPYYLGVSAERAWSVRLLDQAQAELEKNGFIQFNLEGGQFIRVGAGFIEVCLGDTAVRCGSEDIADLSIADGTFTLRRKDATSSYLGLFEEGVFTFQYGEMANARLFLIALEELAGFEFS